MTIIKQYIIAYDDYVCYDKKILSKKCEGVDRIMICENEYCIYQKENRCHFPTTTINSLGMCDGCIIISLDKNFLKEEKERQFQELENRLKD